MTLFGSSEKSSGSNDYIFTRDSIKTQQLKIKGMTIKNGIAYHIPSGSGTTVLEPVKCKDCGGIFYLVDPKTYTRNFNPLGTKRSTKNICRFCKSHDTCEWI